MERGPPWNPSNPRAAATSRRAPGEGAMAVRAPRPLHAPRATSSPPATQVPDRPVRRRGQTDPPHGGAHCGQGQGGSRGVHAAAAAAGVEGLAPGVGQGGTWHACCEGGGCWHSRAPTLGAWLGRAARPRSPMPRMLAGRGTSLSAFPARRPGEPPSLCSAGSGGAFRATRCRREGVCKPGTGALHGSDGHGMKHQMDSATLAIPAQTPWPPFCCCCCFCFSKACCVRGRDRLALPGVLWLHACRACASTHGATH